MPVLSLCSALRRCSDRRKGIGGRRSLASKQFGPFLSQIRFRPPSNRHLQHDPHFLLERNFTVVASSHLFHPSAVPFKSRSKSKFKSLINASSSATTRISISVIVGDVNRGRSGMTAVCPLSSFLLLAILLIIPALVIQDLELQPGPNGQIVHGNLVFSRATESQDLSGSARLFNNLILPSPSAIWANPLPRLLQVAQAANYQAAAAAPSRRPHHTVALAV